MAEIIGEKIGVRDLRENEPMFADEPADVVDNTMEFEAVDENGQQDQAGKPEGNKKIIF